MWVQSYNLSLGTQTHSWWQILDNLPKTPFGDTVGLWRLLRECKLDLLPMDSLLEARHFQCWMKSNFLRLEIVSTPQMRARRAPHDIWQLPVVRHESVTQSELIHLSRLRFRLDRPTVSPCCVSTSILHARRGIHAIVQQAHAAALGHLVPWARKNARPDW